MSQSRKFCLYKGCDNKPGRTMFRFPTDKERFYVWVKNAGLDLKGDVNVGEYRYLCDKHFSSKYVSNQSRRKMLVHTAVPEKWNEEVSEPEFTIIGEPVEKKRKSQFPSRESIESIQITTQPPIILNNQKRKLEHSTTSNEETIEMIESDGGSVSANHDIVYEEVIIPPNKKSFKCVVVKQKKSKSPTKTIMNYIQPTTSSDQVKEEDTFFLTEEGNITSTNVEQKDDIIEEEEVQPAVSYSKKQQASVESYSEFIFNGEIYVQMPKRIFEAEKEKIRGESVKYKAMLLKLRKQIDELLEN